MYHKSRNRFQVAHSRSPTVRLKPGDVTLSTSSIKLEKSDGARLSLSILGYPTSHRKQVARSRTFRPDARIGESSTGTWNGPGISWTKGPVKTLTRPPRREREKSPTDSSPPRYVIETGTAGWFKAGHPTKFPSCCSGNRFSSL